MIVTHVSPDWDAIMSVWLLKRFGDMSDADVQFVNTGAPDKDLLASADAVVDTGREYDVTRWRFDHHHLPGAEANSTSAALMVWEWLFARAPIPSERFDALTAIEPLIQLVFQGDTGRREADFSRRLGIHALLSNKKRQGADNYALLAYGFDLLDNLAQSLISQKEVRESLEQHTVYASSDGLVVALLNAPQGATFAAHEAGARLVVFASELPDVPTYARGVMRGGEGADVHCGKLIETLLMTVDDDLLPLQNELASWFRHEAGFFAGKGTQKAPCADLMMCDIRDVAKAIDAAWIR